MVPQLTQLNKPDTMSSDLQIRIIKKKFLELIKTSQLETIEDSIKAQLVDANIKYGGKPLITIASSAGWYDIVKALIQQKADVNATTNGGYTALMRAVYGGYIDIVKLLVESGANVNLQTHKHKLTALMMIDAINPNLSIIKILLDANSDVYLQNHNGNDLLKCMGTSFDKRAKKLIEDYCARSNIIYKAVSIGETVPYSTLTIYTNNIVTKRWIANQWIGAFIWDINQCKIQVPVNPDVKVEYHVVTSNGVESFIKFPPNLELDGRLLGDVYRC